MKTNLKEVNGMYFAQNTPYEICNIISSIDRNTRIRVWYGDKTGKSWGEENDITGYISKTTGNTKCPILVHNSRSYGGGLLLSDCIVKIVETKTNKTIYIHPNFSQPKFTVNNNNLEVYGDGKLYARFNKTESAERYCKFMNGGRHSK